MAKELSNQEKWRPWKGIILYIVIVAMLFGSGYLSTKIGFWSALVFQVLSIVIAVAACLINKTSLKEVFPVHKFTARDFFGILLLWFGALPLNVLATAASNYLFPQASQSSTSEFLAASSSLPIAMFAITVICAPISEGMLYYGSLLSNFRSFKKDWVIVLLIGVMYGLSQFDAVRFLSLAILGACMAYLVVKRNNIVLPVIFQIIHNLFSVGINYISMIVSPASAGQADAAVASSGSASVTLQVLAGTMVISFLSPLFLVLGAHLIKRQYEISEGKEKTGMKLGAKIGLSIIPCVILLAAGIALLATSGALNSVS